MAKSRTQQEIDRIFAHMEQAIRLHDYDPADLFYMIADLTPVNPTLAVAIGKHAHDFIKSEECDENTEWTDIVVEAYRRALFDEEASPLYGTGYFIGRPDLMTKFVSDYIKNHTLGDTDLAGSNTAH